MTSRPLFFTLRDRISLLGCGFGQQLFHLDMCENDVGLPLQRLVVAPLESIAFFRRTNQRAHVREEMFHFHDREFRIIIQQFVDTNDEL